MDALVFLTSFMIVLLAGIVSIMIAKWLKLPLPLVLFLVGIFLSGIMAFDHPLIQFDGSVLSTFSIIMFVIVLFDAMGKIRWTHLEDSFKHIGLFFVFSVIFNLVVIRVAVMHFFQFEWFSAVLFALLISCVEFTAIFPKQHVPKNHMTQFSKDESIISEAFVLLVPFLIILFVQTVKLPFQDNVVMDIMPFAALLFTGASVGILIAMVFFKLVRMKSFEQYALWFIGIAALLAFVLAEKMQGSGLIAVATLGIIFGSVVFKQRNELQHVIHRIESALEVFLFLLVGIIVGIPQSWQFLGYAAGLFFLYLLIRFFIASVFLRGHSMFERLELSFFAPKGLVTASVAFVLLNYTFTGAVQLAQLLLVFFIYSLIFETVLEKFGFYAHH